MKTRLLRVDARDPHLAVLKEAAGILLEGGLVAFPTESFYGLGANALDPKAFARVYSIKERQAGKPLLVLVDSVRMVETLVEAIPPTALVLMTRYWPGPLTLVLKAVGGLPAHLTAGRGTIGVRLPGHPVAFGLVRAAGVPVTAPSANRSGEEPPTTAAAVLEAFDGRIELVVDGGQTKGGLPSTILDLTAAPPRILRKGALELPESALA